VDGLEALFELEDGALEEVVGESGGGDGEAERQWDADQLVMLEVEHARKAIVCVEDQPEEEQEKQIKAVGDFAEVDQRSGYPDLDVEYGDKDQEGAEEDEGEGGDEREGSGCGERLERKELAGLEPEGEPDNGDCSSLLQRQKDGSAVEPEGHEAASGEELELHEAINPDDSAGGTVESEAEKHDVGERDGDDADDDDAAAATEAHDGRDGEIELLFHGEAPERANRAKPTVVKDVEVADEEGEGENRVSRDGGTAVIEPTQGVASEENEEVEGPYPQDAAYSKCAKIHRSGGFLFT